MERRWQVLLVVCVGVFVASLDLFIVNIAFPDIAADFSGSDLADLSWVLNAYTIVFAALLVPAGRLADSIGNKRAFLGGLALFTAASVACAAAGSVETLVGARIVQAVGAAFLLPTSLALLLREFPAEQRPVAIGVWAASGGVAAAAGPPVGGLLVELSWHWVFLVNLPVGVAAITIGSRILREARATGPDAGRIDVPGAVAVTLGTGALIAAIVNGDSWGWTSTRTLALSGAAVVLLGAVVLRTFSHPAPILEREVVGVRSFRLAVSGGLLFFVAFAAMLLGSVLFLTEVWDKSVLTAGLMVAPGPATAAAFSVPGARLGERIGPHRVGALGGLLFAIGAASWAWRLGDDPAWARDFLPGMLIGGAGVGLVNPALTSAAAASLPPARFATGAAVLGMGRQVGTALGVAILVPVLGVPTGAGSFDGVWLVMVLGALAAAASFLAIGPLHAPRPSARPTAPAVTTVEVPA
ncbi:MFS transporter [Paraconexibacter sp.]|uniref:MFS transporter n=1 Tax=Paraconexibacter sp. TaxID=2949640 RepID=UPI0035624B34